jgi:hypothetical protein
MIYSPEIKDTNINFQHINNSIGMNCSREPNSTSETYEIPNHAPENPCGGGVEYLHRDPASRKRRRNGAKKGRAIA